MAPRRQAGRWWWPLVFSGALFAVATTALHLLGVAGYRVGWLWPALCYLALIVVARRRLGPGFPGRPVWTVAAALIAVTATAWMVDHAPLSAGRLRAEMAGLAPPFSRQVAETTRGHSWCRPRCPEVERTYRAPKTATFGALLNVAGQLRKRGLLPDLITVGRRHPQRYLRVTGDRYVADIRVTPADDHLRVTITLSARRDAGGRRAAPEMAAPLRPGGRAAAPRGSGAR